MGRRMCDQQGGSGVPTAVSMGAMLAPSTRSTGNGLSSLDASVLGLRRMGERNMSFSRGAVGVRAENREFSCEKSDQVIYLGPIAREENSRFCARTTPCGVSIERVTNASRTVLELRRLDSSDRAPLDRDHGYDDERFLTLCVPAE